MRWLQAIANAVGCGGLWPNGQATDPAVRRGIASFSASWLRSSAHSRALQLLHEHLSPAQRDQFDLRGFFDVIGSDTGRRYRIHYGMTGNINEYNATGGYVRSWCFHPAGHLPIGDVLLAQKLALEYFECEALSIANTMGVRMRAGGLWEYG